MWDRRLRSTTTRDVDDNFSSSTHHIVTAVIIINEVIHNHNHPLPQIKYIYNINDLVGVAHNMRWAWL